MRLGLLETRATRTLCSTTPFRGTVTSYRRGAKGHELFFDDVKAVQLKRKRTHFYAALVYIKSYPKKNEMPSMSYMLR